MISIDFKFTTYTLYQPSVIHKPLVKFARIGLPIIISANDPDVDKITLFLFVSAIFCFPTYN